jgi:hypothetical protein
MKKGRSFVAAFRGGDPVFTHPAPLLAAMQRRKAFGYQTLTPAEAGRSRKRYWSAPLPDHIVSSKSLKRLAPSPENP